MNLGGEKPWTGRSVVLTHSWSSARTLSALSRQVQHPPTPPQSCIPGTGADNSTGKSPFVWLLRGFLFSLLGKIIQLDKKKTETTQTHQSFFKVESLGLWICHHCNMVYFQLCTETGQQISRSCWECGEEDGNPAPAETHGPAAEGL